MAYMTIVDEAISLIPLDEVHIEILLNSEPAKPKTQSPAEPDEASAQTPDAKSAQTPDAESAQAPDAESAQTPDAPTLLHRIGYVPRDRILYFYSRNPDILQCVINEGERLWELILNLPAMQTILAKQEIIAKDESFNNPTKDKPILELDLQQKDRITLLHNCGQLLSLSEYRKIAEKDSAFPAPACLYMTDYGTSASKSSKNDIDIESESIKWFLDNPKLKHSVLLISSPYNTIPDGFEDRIRLIDVPQIDLEDITALILDSVSSYSNEQRSEVTRCARRYLGLSRKQVEAVLYQLEMNLGVTCEAFVLESDPPTLREDCRRESLRLIAEEKKQTLKKHPAIVYLDTTESVKAVGMDNYENWLNLNKEYFIHSDSVAPCGVVFVGPPGTGKTLMARRTAQEFDCPAVEFSLSMVKGSKYGESTKNLKKYLSLLEDAAPIVVLVDEAEKDLSYGNDTHEVTASLIGMLLSWMQKRKKSIFLYFTSNDISRMPPELRRVGGRVDAIYFSGMPWGDELSRILQANLIRADALARQDGKGGLLGVDLINSFIQCEKEGKAHEECKSIIESFADIGNETKRALLFSGADLEQIIRDTRKRLAAKKARVQSGQGESGYSVMPFSLKDFKEAMEDYVRTSFRATGERKQDMDAIVRLYELSQQNSYLPVSNRTALEDILREKPAGLPECPYKLKYDKLLYDRIGKLLMEINKKAD